MMQSRIIFFLALLFLSAVEILRVFFIMPFPGSQRSETIALAYFIDTNILWFRLVGFVLIVATIIPIWKNSERIMKAAAIFALLVWLTISYLFNFKFLAEKMFYQPTTTIFASASDNKILGRQLVIGVSINNQSKAYPIEIIGYHHQVRDTLAGQPIMVTYCTVCRTGRVYKPIVDGQLETFRLVGMDHFNAMFEDSRTKSWWRQANGEVLVGPLKGKALEEIPSEQMTLEVWLELHPDSKIMQPDSLFLEEYHDLRNFDEGKSKGSLTRADTLSWREKSWVVGVALGEHARAYDWKELQHLRIINDAIANTKLAVVLEADTASFHVFLRDSLEFAASPDGKFMTDSQTQSKWTWRGECVEGTLAGAKLKTTQSYQEFWHSWKTFHPQTTEYRSGE